MGKQARARSVWADLDEKEAAYQAKRTWSIERIKELSREDPGNVEVEQDEFGWWRATVKIWIGFGALDSDKFLVHRYQSRTHTDLVEAVRTNRRSP